MNSTDTRTDHVMLSAVKKVVKSHVYHAPTVVSMAVVVVIGGTMLAGNADVSGLSKGVTRAAGAMLLVSGIVTFRRAMQ